MFHTDVIKSTPISDIEQSNLLDPGLAKEAALNYRGGGLTPSSIQFYRPSPSPSQSQSPFPLAPDPTPTTPSFSIPSSASTNASTNSATNASTNAATHTHQPSPSPAIPSSGRTKFVHAVTQKLVALAIDELKQPETIRHIKDHILAPVVRLIYAQIYPYLIVAAIVVLCALVMWVLMFLMFTMAFFRGGK